MGKVHDHYEYFEEIDLKDFIVSDDPMFASKPPKKPNTPNGRGSTEGTETLEEANDLDDEPEQFSNGDSSRTHTLTESTGQEVSSPDSSDTEVCSAPASTTRPETGSKTGDREAVKLLMNATVCWPPQESEEGGPNTAHQ